MKKRMPIINDSLAGKFTLVILMGYLALFGLLKSHGWHAIAFTWPTLIIVVPIFLTDSLRSLFELFIPSEFYEGAQDLSKITVIIACKDGQDVIPATIKDLLKKFDKNRIYIASNGSTDRTCAIARQHGVHFLNFHEPLGKVRAINFTLSHIETPYVLIMDDDVIVGDAVLPTQALDDGYEAVAFRVYPIKSTWVSKLQYFEYRRTMDIGKKYHNRHGSVQNISGAIGLFRVKELQRQIRLHTGEFSGEDLQRTLLIHMSKDSRGVVITESKIYTLVPENIRELFFQRIRGWYPGLYSNFRRYIEILLSKSAPSALRFDAFYNCFVVMIGDVFRLLSLPILVYYPLYFAVMYCVYGLIELIQYRAMGKEDPWWVVISMPFYGLFGFITRIVAFGVFVFRRLSVKIGKALFLDDFNTTGRLSRIVALSLTILLVLVLPIYRLMSK